MAKPIGSGLMINGYSIAGGARHVTVGIIWISKESREKVVISVGFKRVVDRRGMPADSLLVTLRAGGFISEGMTDIRAFSGAGPYQPAGNIATFPAHIDT